MADPFLRSPSGLANEPRFHGVEIIAYLEGGNHSYTIEESLDEDLFSPNTLDVAFWAYIFRKYSSIKNVKFKSVGAKTTVKKIAEKIIQENLTNIVTCMDNEFDELLNSRIEDRRVFYTYGYSWENEVWDDETICNLVDDFSSSLGDSSLVLSRIHDFLKDITDGVKADYLCFCNSLSFFPRKGLLLYNDTSKNNLQVNIGKLEQDIENQGITREDLDLVNFDVAKYCFGHLYADVSFNIIQKYLKKELSIDAPGKECCNRIAISKYINKTVHKEDVKGHYERLFERFNSHES